jgi:hypothetical protein
MNEPERIWKHTVDKLRYYAGSCLAGLQEVKKILRYNSRCKGRYSNTTSPEYDSSEISVSQTAAHSTIQHV